MELILFTTSEIAPRQNIIQEFPSTRKTSAKRLYHIGQQHQKRILPTPVDSRNECPHQLVLESVKNIRGEKRHIYIWYWQEFILCSAPKEPVSTPRVY